MSRGVAPEGVRSAGMAFRIVPKRESSGPRPAESAVCTATQGVSMAQSA